MSNQDLFVDRLINAIKAKGTPCIVGLDPVIEYMPEEFSSVHNDSTHLTLEDAADLLFAYNTLVIDAVHDLVPAVKPQAAYYERYGSKGVEALEKTVTYAKQRDLLVILDAKRGDIGSTSRAYAEAYLGREQPQAMEIDCMTLSPYLGYDSIEPFIDVSSKHNTGVFICVMTSNPGAKSLQGLTVDKRPIYQIVADMLAPWVNDSIGPNGYSSVGAVVGATYPDEALVLRQQLPASFFLVPGFGAQKGNIDGVRNCFNSDGLGAVINNSRGIMYPHIFGNKDAANRESIRSAALDFIGEVRACLKV